MTKPPFFSICIPQYERVDHLIHALEILGASTFQDFELCISDDVSAMEEYLRLAAWLSSSGLRYSLIRRETSGRYDRNLRSALSRAQGQYLVLMGNDDCFDNPDSLSLLSRKIAEFNLPDLVISNYRDFSSGIPVHRITAEKLHNGGVLSARELFRSFAFVSGLTLKRSLYETYDSDRWDGTEMYQMGVGCAALLDGARALTLPDVLIRKDILIADQEVDSFRNHPPADAGWFSPISTTLSQLPVVLHQAFAASQFAGRADLEERWMDCVRGLYLFTFPYWIFNYKSVFGHKAAFRLWLTLNPGRLARETKHARMASLSTSAYYYGIGASLLALPSKTFESLQPIAYRIAKAIRKA